jgi:hypothetical protein
VRVDRDQSVIEGQYGRQVGVRDRAGPYWRSDRAGIDEGDLDSRGMTTSVGHEISQRALAHLIASAGERWVQLP